VLTEVCYDYHVNYFYLESQNIYIEVIYKVNSVDISMKKGKDLIENIELTTEPIGNVTLCRLHIQSHVTVI
jgi:hypothetical protein